MTEPHPLDDLIRSEQPPKPAPVTSPPKGWAPGIRWKAEGNVGEAIMAVEEGQDPAWIPFLESMGYGDVVELVRVTEIRTWEVAVKGADGDPTVQQLRYLKAKVVRREEKADRDDVEELKDWIRETEVRVPKLIGPGVKTLLLAFSDWQAGKREGGGSRAMVERVLSCIQGAVAYVQSLRRLGHLVHDLEIVCLGDLVESCEGHYPMQQHLVDLHMRQQRAVVRRLILRALKDLRPHFRSIRVRAVPGNHGEERRGGKAFTHFSDNNDVCVVDQVADVVEEASWGEGIEVYTTSMDEPQLAMAYELTNDEGDSIRIGLAHGHQAGSHSKGDPAGKVKGWWKDCAASRHPIGYVDLLLTGHYHHFRVEDRGEGRTWIQAPTLDGGSFWYWAGGGSGSVPGMLAVLLDPASPRGWAEVKVLDP